MRLQLKARYGKHKIGRDLGTITYEEGDIITVEHESELGNSLDKWIRLDPEEEDEGITRKDTQNKFSMKKRKQGGFNVVNKKTKKKVNDSALTEKEAKELIGDLENA